MTANQRSATGPTFLSLQCTMQNVLPGPLLAARGLGRCDPRDIINQIFGEMHTADEEKYSYIHVFQETKQMQ